MQNLTLSITQLNNYIKQIFDNEELLLGISVYGEVTNFKISNSIAYFDIKDDGASLSCVKFSCFAPFAKNGDKILVTGRLNYHVKLGRLSFVVNKVEKYGMGEQYKKYLELKSKLESEGLFDSSKKKPIPKFAKTIGVVTSETGAVIRDIYHVTRAKNPKTNILVYPAKVQGEGAEKEICNGIKYFNDAKNVDVIIIARGGGSFEDLSPFNSESVARAVFGSELPIISAVGHETDYSISDFASDLRAPTPSVAAELAVYNYYDEIQYLFSIKDKLSKMCEKVYSDGVNNVKFLIDQITGNISSRLELEKKTIAHKQEMLTAGMNNNINRCRKNLEIVVARIEKSNPLTILKTGYAKVLNHDKSVNTIAEVGVGDEIETILKDGKVISKVKEIKEIKL